MSTGNSESRTAARPRSSRGRPPQRTPTQTYDLLVEAASDAFLENGYGATSMDDVARRAGVSKKTIYCIFDGKAQLLAAVIGARRDAFLITMDATSNTPDEASLVPTLRAMLTGIARLVLDPKGIAVYRLVMSETTRFPEIAPVFYESGPQRTADYLARWIERQNAKGLLAVVDPLQAATMLISMTVSDTRRRVIMGVAAYPDAEQIDRLVGHVMDLFLNGARPRR